MRVDFYQLTRDPAELVVPLIARAALNAGARLLVVDEDAARRAAISEALWTRLPETFLAHGEAAQPHPDKQPILLSDAPEAANGARYVVLSDGHWRDEAYQFDRAFLLFGEATIAAARQVWREVKARDGLEPHFWRQDGGRWQEVA